MFTKSMGLANVVGVNHLPKGIPAGSKAVPRAMPSPIKPDMPGEGLLRAVNYMADYGGCAFYRCMGPNLMLNLYQKAIIQESTTMVLDPRFYAGIKAVKLQRQATPQQFEFVKLLKEISKQEGFKIIYEIDDIVFREDIPLYNKNRDAFTSDEIRHASQGIMELCDEITVTCPFMRDYFKSKLQNQNVTVVPNYLMRWWFDRWFDLGERKKVYELGKKKKHTIAIFASGTHIDVLGRTNYQDDFAAIWPYIQKTCKEYNWHFYGSYPLPLKPLIDAGHMKFTSWVQLPDFPKVMAKSGASLTFAALQDNAFNRAKSPIKLLESGALGIPCICPDMCTYSEALFKYTTGSEFIDQIQKALKDEGTYLQYCKKSRRVADDYWLEDEKNLQKHYEAYFTPFGSSERKFLA